MIYHSNSRLPHTQAIILAGGQGERLLPLTAITPKPALPFGGSFRIIDFTLSNCLHSKISAVTLLTQYRHEDLHSYVRTGWRDLWSASGAAAQPPLCLAPSTGKRYRGTADAVYQSLTALEPHRSEYVLILSGDHVYHMDYRELLAQHVERHADATIATIEHPVREASHFGVVEVHPDFRVTGFEEKPADPRPLPSRPDRTLVSMGVYAFRTKVLIEALKQLCGQNLGYDFGRHVIPWLIGRKRVFAYDFRDVDRDAPRYWRDIGTIDNYYQASMDLVRTKPAFNPYVNDYDAGQTTRHPSIAHSTSSRTARLHSRCELAQSVLSPGVCIGRGASIRDSVLMPGVHIGKDASIRNAIIGEGVHVPPGVRIGWNAEADRRNYVVSPAGVIVVSGISGNRNTLQRTAIANHETTLAVA